MGLEGHLSYVFSSRYRDSIGKQMTDFIISTC